MASPSGPPSPSGPSPSTSTSVPVPVPLGQPQFQQSQFQPQQPQQPQQPIMMWVLTFSINSKPGKMFVIAKDARHARMCMLRAWMESGGIANHSLPTAMTPDIIKDIQVQSAKSKAENEAFAKTNQQDIVFYSYGEMSMRVQIDDIYGGSRQIRIFRKMDDVIRYGLIEPINAPMVFTMSELSAVEEPMRVRLADLLTFD